MNFNNDIFLSRINFPNTSMLQHSLTIGASSTPSSSSSSNVTDGNDVSFTNDSFTYNDTFGATTREYIFDRTEVRYVFITLYSLVFCFCFFGEYFSLFCTCLLLSDDDDSVDTIQFVVFVQVFIIFFANGIFFLFFFSPQMTLL